MLMFLPATSPVMAIFEYDTHWGPVRAFYQTLTTSSSRRYYENFLGDQGSLVVSESAGQTAVYQEPWLGEGAWDQWVEKGYLVKPLEEETEKAAAKKSAAKKDTSA